MRFPDGHGNFTGNFYAYDPTFATQLFNGTWSGTTTAAAAMKSASGVPYFSGSWAGIYNGGFTLATGTTGTMSQDGTAWTHLWAAAASA